MDEAKRGRRKTRTGIVVSDKMQKTITILVNRTLMHARYGRIMRTRNKIMVHDPDQQAGIGDRVRVMETRPLSKHKRWRLVEVLDRAK